jgi:hypothetical protein
MSVREDVWAWLSPALDGLKSVTEGSWEERRATFLEQLGLTDAAQHPVVADLLHQLDESPDEERAATLRSDHLDSWAYGLIQAHTAEPEDQDAPASGYDEQAWQAFLVTNGASWDGTAESWPAFRQWFEYHAAEQGLAEPSTALLDYLESQPATERVSTFALYGVTIAVRTTDGSAGEQAGAGSAAEEPEGELTGELAELRDLIDTIPDADELLAEIEGKAEEVAEK